MNVLATARHVWPAATAATTRSRRSKEYARAIPAGLQPSQQVESDSRRFGNPSRFSQSRSRSSSVEFPVLFLPTNIFKSGEKINSPVSSKQRMLANSRLCIFIVILEINIADDAYE